MFYLISLFDHNSIPFKDLQYFISQHFKQYFIYFIIFCFTVFYKTVFYFKEDSDWV